ncbi:hypothetical protein SAMN05216417_12811 [Nitrosospira multiformis]|uniref:Uncharacterized protein n=1 Tax=Nitrosospira multiformis TaxID=1231 RepID=A0A1I7IVD5_9PROT|nr:hypothetical protein SAMN05216417_12811 [Nitrosospira multiformis]
MLIKADALTPLRPKKRGDNDMYFELQLSASVFTTAIRNRLRALDLCVDLSIPNPSGGFFVVDQITSWDTLYY